MRADDFNRFETAFGPVDQTTIHVVWHVYCEHVAATSHWDGFVNPETPFELSDIDDTPTMGTLAYLPHVVPGLNLE